MSFGINQLTTIPSTLHKLPVAVFSAMALLTLAISAQADMVVNGSFESTTAGPGQFDYQTTATGWTSAIGNSNAYNFIFAAGTADTSGSNGQYGNVQLWGPGNGSANGLPAASPDGGNYVGADGAFQVGAISQTINGLNAGDSYLVGFWWAGSQQYTFTGDTTEQWQVSLGAETQSTAVAANASHGFTGWMYQTFTFTADGSSDVLSFLAVGTPNGSVPPFVLLDGVSLDSATPEPGTMGLLAAALIGALGLHRWRTRPGR